MDQWDELLERSIAARISDLAQEIKQETDEADGIAIHPENSGVEDQRDLELPVRDNEEDVETEETHDWIDKDSTLSDDQKLRQSEAGDISHLQLGEIQTVTLSLNEQRGDGLQDRPPVQRKQKTNRRTDRQPASRPRAEQGESQKRSRSVQRSRRPKRPLSGLKPVHKVVEAAPEAAKHGEKEEKKRSRMTSLQARWLVNSMGAVSLVMIAIGVLALVFLSNYFYSTMINGLENKAQTAAEFFSNYQEETEYLERAASYVANFGEADTIELEFIDVSGEIILSSYAYQQSAGVAPGTDDIAQALEAQTVANWTGSDPITGERIMAVSAPVLQNGSVKGVIRMVSSLQEVDRQLGMLSLFLFILVAGVLVVIYLTNLYFVKSIAEPIASITETTKRIAAGSYGVQIEKKYNDEIGELVDTINDMSRRVSEAEKVKSEFISSVSHELRTPLTAINGWGETLVRGEVTDRRDLQKGLEIIVSEAKRLTKMVEELLEFSRIEDGRFTLRIEQIDIKAELEDAVYTYREFFRKKGITLVYQDCEEEFPPMPGDPERLRQVFSNLLDNAAKHGGSGKRIDVAIRPDGDFVAITIRDYGHGIPEEELPHVKTKFYKGSSKARGSGIGLAVCDEIAQRHNGSLDIENASGKGCIVTLRLPLHEEN